MLHRSCSVAGYKMDSLIALMDEKWYLIEDFFPNKMMIVARGPPECNNRRCFEGILWVLVTGARWKDFPPEYL